MGKNVEYLPLTELLETIVDNRGKSVPTVSNGFPLIATNCIKNSSIYPTFENIRYVSPETLKSWFRAELKPNDILFVNKGNPGRVCLVPNPVSFCVAQDMVGLRCNPQKVYYKYLFAYMRTSTIQKKIANYHVGIMIPHFKKEDLKNLIIPVPDMNVQISIGNLYFSLSEKIENNNNLISELESLAKTIYDYWFLQFEFPNEEGMPYKSNGGKMIWSEELKREIPEGWKCGVISNLGKIISGGTPSTSNEENYSKCGIAWITPKDLSNTSNKYISHGERDISEKGLNSSSATLMPKGAVLLSSRAPIGYLAIALNELTTNQGFKSIVPNVEYSSEYIYYTLKTSIPALINKAGQTTFKEISKDTLSNFEILLPEKKLLFKYNEFVFPLSEKIKYAEEENRRLTELRDYLLPMLMNGQVGFANNTI